MKYMEITRRNEESLVSPTPLTNALRRPKSPRTGRIAPKILAAERFQQMDPPQHQPLQQQHQQHPQQPQATTRPHSKSRPRPRPDAPNPQTPTASEKQQKHRQHRRISSSPPTVPLAPSSKLKSRAYAKHDAKRVAAKCVDRGAAIGKQMSDCIVMTSELYRREFAKKPKDRGDDAAFFMYHENPTMTNQEDDGDSDPLSSSNASTASKDRLNGPPKILNIVKKEEFDSQSDAATPFISNRGVRYPQAKNITDMRDDVMLDAMPSPQREHTRRPRGQHTEELYDTDKTNFYQVTDPRFEFLSDYSDLRELRLQMMRRDLEDENERPENKLSKAMHSIRTQDATITTLRQELDDTRELLERYREELQETREQAEKRTAIAERSSAKIFRDRIDVEQRLRIEIKQNQQLMEQINSLHDEATQLRLSLKSSDSSGKQQQQQTQLQQARSVPESITTQSDDKLTEEAVAAETKKLKTTIIELKTEVVDLRTQLAEAKAARLAAEEERAELKVENEGLRTETRMLRHQVNELRTQMKELLKEADTSKEVGDKEAHELKEELKRVKNTLAQSNAELISNYKKSERLEEALTETQEEALKLREQVCDYMRNIEETKRDAENKVKVSEEEARRLQDEVVNVKKQLAKTNSHIVIQASAQRLHRDRVREELNHARVAAQSLQTRILQMDSKLTNAESEARGIRARTANKDNVSVVQSTTTEGLVELVHRKSDQVMDLLRRRLEATADQSPKAQC